MTRDAAGVTGVVPGAGYAAAPFTSTPSSAASSCPESPSSEGGSQPWESSALGPARAMDRTQSSPHMVGAADTRKRFPNSRLRLTRRSVPIPATDGNPEPPALATAEAGAVDHGGGATTVGALTRTTPSDGSTAFTP